MDKILIEGGRPLEGHVKVSGSKNAALPIMAATLLTEQPVVLENVPQLRDVQTMIALLEGLGKHVQRDGSTLEIHSVSEDAWQAPYEVVCQMRASICVLGPLAAKRKRARVSLPGGCVIGPRPVDLHLKALQALGADVSIEHGDILVQSPRLQGAEVLLQGAFGPSVLATANLMMAAVLSNGKTVIESAAREPEVEDLANFLKSLGAHIEGAGSSRIEIEGVQNLGGGRYRVISDRIEAGTYLLAAVITQGQVQVENFNPQHLNSLIPVLKGMNQKLEIDDSSVTLKAQKPIAPVNLRTAPYPGFPTDLQAQLISVLCLAQGQSLIEENIYPDRFMHIGELSRMGASIQHKAGSALVTGVQTLKAAPVMSSDLRASAALVLAALAAEGQTEVSRVYHLDRGYEALECKLSALGAKIERLSGVSLSRL